MSDSERSPTTNDTSTGQSVTGQAEDTDPEEQKNQEQKEVFEEEVAEEEPDDFNGGVNDGQGLEVMDPSDLFIVRVSQGEDESDIEPVLQKVPGEGKALRIRPLVAEEYQHYFPVDYENDEKLAKLYNRSLADLDWEVSAEDVARGTLPFSNRAIVDCIERAAGKHMEEALQQRQMMQMANMDAEALTGMIQAAEGMDLDEDQMQQMAQNSPI